MTHKFHHTLFRGLFIFICMLAALPAQNPLPLNDAAQKIEAAKEFTRNKAYDQAAAAYKTAIDLYFKKKDMVGMLQTQRSMAKLLGDTMDLPVKGLQYLNTEALPQIWRLPETKEECREYCLLLIRKSTFEKSIGNFDAVKADMLIALPYLENQLAEGNTDLAEYIFRELGNAYVRLGEYEGAEKVFQDNVKYAEARQMPELILYNDYGSLYLSMKNYPEAIKIFERGVLEENVSYADKVILYSNIADYLVQTQQFREALAINRKAEALVAEMDSTEDRYGRCQFCVHENYGMIHLGWAQAGDTAQFSQAENRYRMAIRYAVRDTQAFKREIAGFHIGLGEICEGQGKYEQAIGLYQEAMQLLISGFQGDPRALPDPDMLRPEKFLIRTLEGKANCFLALGDPEKALQCQERIPIVVTQLIATHAYETSSLRALDEGRERFDKGVEIAWQLYEKTKERSYAERAFALTEQARAVLLLQGIAKARRDFRLPPDIRKEESRLAYDIAWYEQRIATEKGLATPRKDQLDTLNAELFQLKRDQQSLKDRLRRDYRDYAELSGQLEFLGTGDVSGLLRNGQAMVDYYLTDTAAYIFYFNKKGDFLPRKATLPPLFREQVLRYFKYISTYQEAPAETQWCLDQSLAWYDLLLRPELENDPTEPEHLLIIPDDALAFIPFDVLLSQPADPRINWRDYKFLLQQYSMGYAYSATLWEMQQRISADHRDNARPKYDFAGFAPSYPRRAGPADPVRSVPIPDSLIFELKNTKPELQKATELMGGLAFYDSTATERQFKETAPDCGILLLAMHGLANDEYPELSCLLFGRPKDNSIDNNVLFSNELQIMRLQADLAVLSACHTGFGKLHKGEGVYSLARAFAVAGVPSIVMSIWRLNDNTAPALTESFFKYLKAGKTKDEALCMAKKDFLKDNKNYERTHPFFWAGVTVSGDMCPLGSTGWWYWLLGGMVVAGIGGIFWYRRKGRV